jgi:hypothetical protein
MEISKLISLRKKLLDVQQNLKAPKNQYNKFGQYKYRSCEDILEAVKPLLSKQGLLLTINDSVEIIGDRFYVRATVDLHLENEKISVTAFAREPENKKGMDESQITGSSSSYARKYALNGLFMIDDSRDADTMDNTSEPAIDLNKYLKKINSFKTIEELKEYWLKIPLQIRLKLEKIKENKKNELLKSKELANS